MIQSVNIISVPAVFDKDGRPACATTSTYRIPCPEQDKAQSALHISGVNSNAEKYFSSSPEGSEKVPVNFDLVKISFSKPFVYPPLSGQFPSNVVNENLGYVPQALIEWMARDSNYVSKFPDISSCLPGGPSLDFSGYFCFLASVGIHNVQVQEKEAASDEVLAQEKEENLTVSSTITVAGTGCFHPDACPTPASPAATAIAATPEVTPEAEPLRQTGASSAAQAQSGMSNMTDLQQENYIC